MREGRTDDRPCPGCRITATDIHQPFLDSVDEKIESERFSGRIRTVRASMDDLPFEEESFDIIRAEGCSFIMGFENAVGYWKKFLKPGGYMMISDLFWFTESPSAETREFFAEIDPSMMIEDKGFEIIRNAGFEHTGSFRLPQRVWEESYYGKVKGKLGNLMEEFKDDEVALMIIEGLKNRLEYLRNTRMSMGIHIM